MFSALRRTAVLLVAPAAVVAFAGPASAATTAPQPVVAPAATGVTQQGIIMSDGRICNPRWGC